MLAANFISRKEGLYLGLDEVISATELAILAFLRRQHIQRGSFKPPRFSDQQLLELSEYADRVPFWKNNQFAQETIRRLRVDPNFLSEVPVFPAAIKTINALAGHIEILGYVTPRPISLYDMTKTYLAKYSLPNAKLYMGPDVKEASQRESQRNLFLEEILERPRGIIEADASLISKLRDRPRPGRVFLLRDIKAFKRNTFELPSFVTRLNDWKSTFKEIQKWIGY